jgi:hypothetical protein
MERFIRGLSSITAEISRCGSRGTDARADNQRKDNDYAMKLQQELKAEGFRCGNR